MKLVFVTTLKPMSTTLTKFITEQHNAVQSWLKLDIEKKIIVCGNDVGYTDFCLKYNLIHEKDCPSMNKVPYVSHMMKCAYKHGDKNDIFIWINADIILLSDFTQLIRDFIRQYPDYPDKLFCITSCRYNWNDFRLIDYTDPQWEEKLLNEKLILDEPNGIDMFIHSYKAFDNIPDLVQARFCHDSWLINRAYQFPINIDATNTIKIIHQFNDWFMNGQVVTRDFNIEKAIKNYSSGNEDIKANHEIWKNVEVKCDAVIQLKTKIVKINGETVFTNFYEQLDTVNKLLVYKLDNKPISLELVSMFSPQFLEVKDNIPDNIDTNTNILITKGGVSTGNKKIMSFKYYKHQDIIGHDLYKTYRNISDLFSYALDDKVKAFNTLGYVKDKIGNIQNNWYLGNGGIVVKTNEISNIYIHCSACNVAVEKNIHHFNIIY